ncbi:hypothetical protein Mth01_14790 [Sphaerimonospora thailandensis]|uniref:Uncharacterized protein n=1 Tax=Sphaerimonospora thailandensis TaxID=795644 RepID=A0A8J3VYT7_9ACTN|nr:hypothetical protein Mth01_14790 [Sphaerimonospora thailandensis]
MRKSQCSSISGRNAKTPSTIRTASGAAGVTTDEWSTCVKGSIAHNTACPEPYGPQPPVADCQNTLRDLLDQCHPLW